MVIDPLRRKVTGEAYAESLRRREKAEQAKGGGPAGAEETGQGPRGEKIEVSDRALLMGRIQRALAEIADVRADIVQAIKERVARDEYHVPGEDIAEKVIHEALKEMRSRGRR